MFHQTFLLLGQLWQLFEVSQILEFLWVFGYQDHLTTSKSLLGSLKGGLNSSSTRGENS